MDIGTEIETVVVEPLSVPVEEPAKTPEKEEELVPA